MAHDALPPDLNATANGRLLDRTILHAHFLERLKTGEVNRIVGFLNRDVYPDLLDRMRLDLDRIGERTHATFQRTAKTKRYQAMLAALDEIIGNGHAEMRRRLNGSLGELSVSESAWLQNAIRRSVPFHLNVTAPPAQLLRSVVTSRPFQGRFLKDWVRDLDQATRKRVRQAIQIGMVEGEGTDDIIRRVRGTRARNYTDGALEVSRRQAQMVVRTAVQHVSAHARNELAQANRDIVKGWVFLATLDTRTSEICIGISSQGKLYPIGTGPLPPQHPLCRSVMNLVLKSAAELGLDLRDVPPGQRASMDGLVPGDLTYGDWLKQQTPARQVEALGPARAAIFRRGVVPPGKFIDRRNKPLNVPQLEALEERLAG